MVASGLDPHRAGRTLMPCGFSRRSPAARQVGAMNKTITGISTLALALAVAGPASADSMRCGSKLMTDGDPTAKVEAMCGPPESIERREILRNYGYNRGYSVNSSYEVSVEIWTYNFGPNKLMYRLRFEDGLLVDIDTLTHGYHNSRTGV
jgi:hypothetical protein